MHKVISLLLQIRKFWWYLWLTSLMLLQDIIMTSSASDSDTVRSVFVLAGQSWTVHQHSAPRTCNSWTAASRNAKLSCTQPVASKQPRSQSCELGDLGCLAALSLPQTNKSIVWNCEWIETAAHRCLLQFEQSIFKEAIDQWRGRHWACVHAKGGHFEYSLWTDCWFCPYLLHSMWLVLLLHL